MRSIKAAALSKFRTALTGGQTTLRGASVSTAAGFTILEILVVMGMLMMLVLAAVSAVTLLNRTSRRQADHTTAIEAAQGKLDEILAKTYNPPLAPFTSTNYTQNQTVTLAVNRDGTATTTIGSLTTTVQPVLNGHVATVVVTYTNYNQPSSVRLQTLINQLSGGQP